MTIPDLSIYSAADIAEFRSLVKAERIRRLKGEAVQSGSKNGKNYTLTRMTDAELSMFEQALATRIGTRTVQKRRMNFNTRRAY